MKKIALHSVPRSGSSWLGQILNSCESVNYKFQPLFSYEFKNYLNEKSSKNKINTFFKKIAMDNSDFLIQKDKINQGLYPRFTKTDYTHVIYKEVRYHHILDNLLEKDKELKIIGLIRNPYAIIYSYLNSPREFRKDLGWNELEEWEYATKKNLGKKEEFFGYNKWKEVYFLFNKLNTLYPNRFLIVYYDNLLQNTLLEVKNIFKFCELDLSNQVKEFLNSSKSTLKNSTYSVYRKKKSDDLWENKLNNKIAEKIKDDLKKNRIPF